MLAEYRATGDQLITQEWIQLEAWGQAGQTFAPGFSGAAVTLATSGKVVGMVTSAARSKEVRNGRMLPAHVMAHYWPRLGDLIPTGGISARDKERLRTLIEATDAQKTWRTAGCAPDRLYRDAVGPLPPPLRRLTSLWDVAWYLLSESQDTEAIGRFAARLADYCEDAATRAALRGLLRGQV
uniref:hypothetical protein n=1 Tax=Streptomyces polyasparticus TaxID=2767826 RepID=UPI001F1BD860|nr:hypothetical protein [Streptomyces polyasparticus]